MSEYQLQIKQMVDHPRCRIYRQFVQSLINDRSIRVGGGSGLFYYIVLCSYANFQTSYRRIDGISYTVYPGEWICTTKELSAWFRTRFQGQAVEILEELQRKHLISYLPLDRGKVIKYKIRGWSKHNTILDYSCPSQKDTGFSFFLSLQPQNWSVQVTVQKWISYWIFGFPPSITMSRCRVLRLGRWSTCVMVQAVPW